MAFPGLFERLAQIRDEVRFHQARGGFSHEVRIIAVTKSHGPDAVRAAFEAGLHDVGENRVQEALGKQEQLEGLPVRWHLIGTLQRNKVRQVIGRFVLLHAVDREDLGVELDRRVTAAAAAPQPVLVEVNCSGEPAKGGVDPESLGPLLDRIRELPGLEVRGLMTMAAFSDLEAVHRQAFGTLRGLRDRMEAAGHPLPELSMGMSGDFRVAVEEGATMIRLGTLLFGDRPR